VLGPRPQTYTVLSKTYANWALRAVLCAFYVSLAAMFTPMGIAVAGQTAYAEETVKTAEAPVAAIKSAAIGATKPESPAIEPPVKIVNTTLIAEVDTTITVTLDGETLKSTEVHRTAKGELYVNAMPIFSALNNDVEYDDVSKALIVRRSQDNVVMELYTETGIVKADGRPLGKLPHFGEVKAGRYLLTPNAIAVMSGASGKFDKESNSFNFKLDPRLRVATGFDIIVNGLSLGNLNPEPRSIGPVLIMPLLPIAEALGHDVTVIDATNEVRVRRAQDSAEFTLNLDTGLPGERVSDLAAKEPFTPESLNFHIGLDTINRVDANFRVKQLNGRVRYETPDLPRTGAEAQPSWLSVDFAHVNGVTGAIGDYSADNRELDGVGLRRIRGLSAVKVTDKGRWAAAIGAPADGAKKISADQSRLTFSGVAAGVRYQSRDGWEAGLSAKKESLSDDQMAVLSAISGQLGRTKDNKIQWDARADLGAFNGPARESSIDLRLGLSGRLDVNPTVTLDANATYDGAEFLRNKLTAETLADDITQTLNPSEIFNEEQDALVPDTRRTGLDQMTVGSSLRLTPNKNIGFLNNPAASIRAQSTISGFATGTEEQVKVDSYGASVATSLGETGISLSADVNAFEQSFANGDEKLSGHGYSARAYKQFEHVTLRAQYLNSKKDGSDARESAALTASVRSFNLPMPKSANLSIAPSATASWTPEFTALRGGIVANFNSGKILGKKTRLDASLGILQSVGGAGGGNGNTPSQTDKYLSVSLSRRMRIGNNMALGLSYRNNLSGDQRVGLQLDGRFDFNEKRKYKQTLDGRGVLKGRAFVDTNRDGIKQESEVAVPNAMVRLKGTRMALRTDRSGFFTIQNIKVGIYDVIIDGRSLPLGYSMAMEGETRVTIHEGRISDVPMPIVQRGQIRGFTFVDDNGNGLHDKGEERIEGASLRISGEGLDEDGSAVSTSFGQYAFDDLSSGTYQVRVLDQKKLGLKGGATVTVNLAEHDRLMARVEIPLIRLSGEVKLAEVEADQSSADKSLENDSPPGEENNTMALARDGPAPP